MIASFQHKPPVFCYCAAFQPPNPSQRNDTGVPLVVTGTFDCAVRLWDPQTGVDLGLLAGKRVHESYVNCLTFDAKTSRLYSGDGDGTIVIWRKQGTGSANRGEDYVCLRKVDKLKELRGVPITSLALNPARPTGRGLLLIMGHMNTLRQFDLSTQRLSQIYFTGVDNMDQIVRATYSPCGTYVIAGSDQGTVMCWNSKTGMRVSSSLDGISYSKPINSITWHPNQHVVAFCSYGGAFPVTLYSADRDPSKQQQKLVEQVEDVVATREEDQAEKEEKVLRRKENRQRYKELKEKALQRKLEKQEKDYFSKE